MQDTAFQAEYDAPEESFALADALIYARRQADMTQEQVATAMGTSQAAVARLESGQTPTTTRTLERFARATGMPAYQLRAGTVRHVAAPMIKVWRANFLESLAYLCYVVAQR